MEKIIVKDKASFWYAIPERAKDYFNANIKVLSTRDMYLHYKRYSLHDAETYNELEEHMVCSVTGEKMETGWKENQFNFHFKYEHHALQWCNLRGFSSIEEALDYRIISEVCD